MADNGIAIAAKNVARPSFLKRAINATQSVKIAKIVTSLICIWANLFKRNSPPNNTAAAISVSVIIVRHPPKNTATTKVANNDPTNIDFHDES